jgi:ADP-heptose:LPS heptosyltransferase
MCCQVSSPDSLQLFGKQLKLYIMKTLVVNLTRMGDLLQTTPLLYGLKNQDPEGRLDLMVVSDFRAVADGFDMVDEVITLDLNGLIPRFESESDTVVNLHQDLVDWISDIRKKSYDRVINLSHTRISAALVRLLEVPDTRGVTLSREGYIVIHHPWLNYFFNVTLSRAYNPINLVDMYLGAGDIKHSPQKLFYRVSEESRLYAESFIESNQPLASRPLYGIQPGAMQESRRWEISSWAKLYDLIWEELNGVVILFGAKPDTKLGIQIEKMVNHPILNVIGQTTIPQLAGLLTRCQVLVTNDTGTMHLASAIGIPVVAIFLAAARADDTAPYGRGHLILEANLSCAPCDYHHTCPNPVCHRMITPEIVLETIKHHPWFSRLGIGGESKGRREWLPPHYCRGEQKGGLIDHSQNQIPFFSDEGIWKSIRLSVTDFDQWGRLIMRPCIPRPLTRKQLLSLAYRYLWHIELSNNKAVPEQQEFLSFLKSALESTLSPIEPISFQSDLESLNKLMELASMGIERATIMSNQASKPDLKVLQTLTAHFVIIDRDIYNWELTHPDLAPLAIHFRIDKGNIEHDDLVSLANKASTLYGDLRRRAERFQQILQTTKLFIARKPETLVNQSVSLE